MSEGIIDASATAEPRERFRKRVSRRHFGLGKRPWPMTLSIPAAMRRFVWENLGEG